MENNNEDKHGFEEHEDDLLKEIDKKVNDRIEGKNSFLDLFKLNSPLFWGIIVIIALLVALLIYFLFFQQKYETATSVTDPVMAEAEGNADAQTASPYVLYNLSEIGKILNYTLGSNYFSLLPQIAKEDEYILQTGSVWSLATKSLDKSHLVSVLGSPAQSNSGLAAGYYAQIKDLPYSDSFRVGQLLNRIKSRGFNAIRLTESKTKKHYITVGPFPTFEKAILAGEDIHFFYKSGDLFPTNFKIKDVQFVAENKIGVDFALNQTIELSSYQSLAMAEEAYFKAVNEAGPKFKDPITNFIFISKEANGDYTLNIGVSGDLTATKALFNLIEDDFPNAKIISK